MKQECEECEKEFGCWSSSVRAGVCQSCHEKDIAYAPNRYVKPTLSGICLLPHLLKGSFGLSVTFWVYGFLSSFILAAVFLISLWEKSILLQEALLCFAFIYYLAVHMGIWSAANKYDGPLIWAALAKFFVLLLDVPAIIFLLLRCARAFNFI